MSILFTEKNIGPLKIPNRLIRSATCECMAKETGEVTPEIINLYEKLAENNVGLIITGHCYVNQMGKSDEYQLGIHNDKMIPGFKKLIETIHKYNTKVAVQLSHAGLQYSPEIKGKPVAPSVIKSPVTFVKPKEMNNEQIYETIQAFADSAKRAFESGADAVQIHAAHGYLVNEFISPFFNVRCGKWGGTDENRFLFLKKIILKIKENMPKDKALLVKLNTNDYTKKPGITPELAAKYSKWLKEIGVDAIETSCGASHFSYMNIWRGDHPTKEILLAFPKWERFLVKMIIKKNEGKYNFDSEYNLDAAKTIKSAVGEMPLILVGGVRNFESMEKIVSSGSADFVSMCRPFIKEPDLVNKLKNKTSEKSSCSSCNRCFAAITNHIPLGCYEEEFPKK